MDVKTYEAGGIMAEVRKLLIENLLEIEDSDALEEDTPLITGGILDSVATVSLVNFLEERYGIEFTAHEINVDNFDRITDIARTILDKLDERS
jgi:acyl carrier protein